jgi:hypothetical protein
VWGVNSVETGVDISRKWCIFSKKKKAKNLAVGGLPNSAADQSLRFSNQP